MENQEENKRQNSQYTLFMITQDIEHHIGKTAKEVNEKIEEAVGENLEFCYSIEHYKCTCDVWNYQTKSYDKCLKGKHIHSVVKLKNKVTINSLADTLGIKPQYIEKPKTKGCNARNNMLAYLIHAREPDKEPYDPKEVVCSKDALSYTEVYALNKKSWDKDYANARTKQTTIDVDLLIEKIEDGEIVDKEQILLTNEYYKCYSRHSRRIDKALEIASERRQAQNVQRIKDGNLKQVIFVTGEPRKGKSYLTDQITSTIASENGWLVGNSATSNCLDDYNGEEIFVLDDARGSSMRAEEWTRLLDPRKANMGSARFHNKMMSPQIIIFNCYKDVDEFFYFTKGIGENDKSEALDQFIGRILIRLVVHGPNDIDLSLSHERPSTRVFKYDDKYGSTESRTIHTDHSFVTVCEHQTNENIVALVASLVCANQHAGKVTEAMMDAVSKINIPYNNILLEDEELKLKREQQKEKRIEVEMQIKDEWEERWQREQLINECLRSMTVDELIAKQQMIVGQIEAKKRMEEVLELDADVEALFN